MTESWTKPALPRAWGMAEAKSGVPLKGVIRVLYGYRVYGLGVSGSMAEGRTVLVMITSGYRSGVPMVGNSRTHTV